MPAVISHAMPKVACPGDNLFFLALLEENPGAGKLNRGSFVRRQTFGGVAQLEERLICNQEVMGSNPITFHYSCVAQLEEHLATNEKVVGSTPAVTTKKFSGL